MTITLCRGETSCDSQPAEQRTKQPFGGVRMDLVYSQPKSMSTLEAQLRAYSDLSEERAQRLASETFNGGPRMSPPITPREDWPHLDDKQLRVVEYRIKRLERAINLAYPLLAGETMDADGVFSSFLSADYLDYPAGTVAVRRRSSFGELFFIDTNFVVRESDITDITPPVSVDLTPPGATTWSALAAEIGKSLLRPLAKEIGSAIFAKLFPPGVPAYFDQVYKEFENIIHGVINENKRRELSGRVNSVQDGMVTYNTIKRDPAKYEESQRMLSTIWNESRTIISELKEFPEIGLGLLVVAGGLHLAIVQEKAITDKDHENPNDSPWADDLIRKSAEFAPFAIENRHRIINTRANAITPVKFIENIRYIPGGGPVDESYWFWRDTFVGDYHKYPKRQGCCDPDPLQTANNDRQSRWDSTVGAMTNVLAAVVPTADDWKKVGASPIPTDDTPKALSAV